MVTEKLTTADGRSLAYRRTGSGPMLVCHPGGPGFSASFLVDLAGLGDTFTLVLLDPRGTGGSDRPADPRAYSLDDYASDVDELRAHLGLERIHLLGYSHGGMVAMRYAGTNPSRVERLVLAGTAARLSAELEEAMQAALAAREHEPWYPDAAAALAAENEGVYGTDEELGALAFREFPLYFARYGDREREFLDTLRGEPANGDTLRLFNAEVVPSLDLRDDLRRTTAPTLVVAGEEDFICGPVAARDIAAAVDGAELVVLPDTGHFLFVEAREQVHDAIAEFLSR
jgi:pimeloyl-ACP methyl ester carboxylesterase